MSKLKLEIPVLLPNVDDERDSCVARLLDALRGKSGVSRVHVDTKGSTPLLCIHYDANTVTLAQLERLAKSAGAAISRRFGHGVYAISKIDSEDAPRRIESDLRAIPGILTASVNLAAQVVRVEWDRSKVEEKEISAIISSALNTPIDTPDKKKLISSLLSHHKELVRSLASGLILAIAWPLESFTTTPFAIVIALYAASYILGAWDLVHHSFARIAKGKFKLNIDFLMLVAALGAAILGKFAEGAMLLFLFALAHALEHYALDKARSAIKALSDIAPQKARVRRAQGEEEVSLSEVKKDDLVIVLPGERIPVDGIVQAGNSSVNQAPITGESVPVEKKAGDDVFAGTINGDGALEILTVKASGDTTLARIIKLVEEAQTQKAPTEIFTEKFERVFVPLVLIVDLLVMVVPPIFDLATFSESFYRAMALLVGASPCALALGTPSAVLAGIAHAARSGVLIKGGAHLENLGNVKAFAFDKTGTLTIGRPEVVSINPFEQVTESELLRIAGAVEQQSQHPLARAVVSKAKSMNLSLPSVGELQSITGKGVKAVVEGMTVELGSLKLWDKNEIPKELFSVAERLQAEGQSLIVVKAKDRWLGILGVKDTLRPGVRDILKELRELKISPLVMLTGDNKGVGDAIGKEAGVDDVKAELLPEDKVTKIKEILSTHGSVAMLGDGVNDAPALAHATVGLSMGAAGTAVALETSDVALMADDLSKLPFVVGLSRASARKIKQNLYVSLSVIALLIVTSVTGLVGIGLAIVLHEGSTMVVIVNSLLLLNFKYTPRFFPSGKRNG